MGCPVDKDLMKLVRTEVTNLEQNVEVIKKSNADEARKTGEALQDAIDEIAKFEKRIADMESRLEEEHQAQSEKNKEFSSAIEDISNNINIIEERQDTNEQNISLLEERQNELESAVTSLKVGESNLTSKVEVLEFGQTQLDSRLKKLEEGNLNAVVDAKILLLPSRNHYFCGRENELKAIAAQLKTITRGCSESAICGLGGVGKTSLAVEFLWRQRDKEEYPGGIFWISGENNNLFQSSVGEMARIVGTFDDKDFSNSLSRTLDWLTKREQLWCLVVDNLDELKMSMDMRKLLTGHWKQAARGHIITTTRREATEIEEEMGIEENSCIELKCFTEEEGVQFLKTRSGTAGEDNDFRKLVGELGGLPLALDQAAAYIRSLRQPIKEYLKKYRKQKMLLLKKKKARNLVENTSPERLAVHTTWSLNFEHVKKMSEQMDLGETPSIVMKMSAYLGPDDIPFQVINEGLHVVGTSGQEVSDLLDAAETVSLLTKFSLFQRYGTDSFSVHRLVQDVIRSEIEKDKIEVHILCCAVHALNHALTKTRSPAEVCQSFVEDAVFSVENPPSLQLWGKLASHSTYLQEHLLSYLAIHENDAGSLHTLLYTDATVRVFNEAAIFFSVSQEKVKAQAMQKKKLELLVHLEKPTPEEDCNLPHYFVDVPLKDKDYKVITCCMRNPPPENKAEAEENNEKKQEADQLREKGNDAFKNSKLKEALDLYTRAIDLWPYDHRLFCNRTLCHLKLGEPRNALEDCQKCLYLKPDYSKALQRKAWALRELVKGGNSELEGQKRAAVAVALHFDPTLRQDKTFSQMFPEVPVIRIREIYNEKQLAFALMTTRRNETLLLREREYHLSAFGTVNDLQIVGLGPHTKLNCAKICLIKNAKCYFENIVFPRGNVTLVCLGDNGAVHLNQCEISGGGTSCEDFPECNGGPGCMAPSLGKPACDRTGRFGRSMSGICGFPGVDISDESSGLIENCVILKCGGGGALVSGKGSRLLVKNCEVFKNHQSGLEAREGGELEALGNKIFDNGNDGILIWKLAGKCDINDNKIFENAKEGIIVGDIKEKITIRNNSIHHNRPFGISLGDDNSQVFISNNEIFENGFWGILAKGRTSAHIVDNKLTGNKCGGIFIGVNYSGRIHLEKNTVRDHSGPWLEYQFKNGSASSGISSLYDKETDALSLMLPEGEKQYYSKPPILEENKQFNNEEGMYHPRELVERLCNGCTYCYRRRDKKVRFLKCPGCLIASYCSKECRRNHRPKHETLCFALKSRYAVDVDCIPVATLGFKSRMFGSHLVGIGEGPKPEPNKEFIVKIQTQTLNSHPLQLLTLYDQSITIDCKIQSPEIFNVIMDCGVLGALNKFTSKKCFFWAMFTKPGGKLTIYLDHLAPYQKW